MASSTSSRVRNANAGNGYRIYAAPAAAESPWDPRDTPQKAGFTPAPAPAPAPAPQDEQPSSANGSASRPRPRSRSTINTFTRQFAGIRSTLGDTSGRGAGSATVDSTNDLARAAALLLAHPSALPLADLCLSCSTTIRDRLSSIASGSFSGGSSTIDPDTKIHPAEFLDSKSATETLVAEETQAGLDKAESLSTLDISKKDDRLPAVPHDNMADPVLKMSSESLGRKTSYNSIGKTGQTKEVETAGQSLHFLENVDESTWIKQVVRKKDFLLLERVNGIPVNILQGLELHCNVLNASEQKELIDYIYNLQELGRSQQLRRRTYSEPRKWMRGKGRVTIQFGCCYNYAVDKDGNPPGIIREEEVDPIPEMFRMVIKRLVRWHVLPPNCVPDSCIVNIYDVGDCIPSHIDHHDFVRPFCTLSLLSECNIIFGTNLKILGPGEFQGSFSIPLPTGSVLILNGNGADVAKHAVPAVPTKRISITFRKMDPSKVPESFRPDQELLSTKPFSESKHLEPRNQGSQSQPRSAPQTTGEKNVSQPAQFTLETDFPPLGMSGNNRRSTK